jgi:hypothetical protein
MGGSDEPSNLVELSIEEHAESHKALYEQYGKWEDYYAWQGLSGQIGKEDLIIEIIKKVNTGRKHSPETNKKKSIALSGKSLVELHGEEKANEIRNKLKKPKTENMKLKMSLVMTGKVQSTKTVSKRAEKNSKNYKITSPDGQIFYIKGLPEFCNKFNLNRSAMGKVSRKIYHQHRGWKCERI